MPAGSVRNVNSPTTSSIEHDALKIFLSHCNNIIMRQVSTTVYVEATADGDLTRNRLSGTPQPCSGEHYRLSSEGNLHS